MLSVNRSPDHTTCLPTHGATGVSIPGSPLDAASTAYGTQPSDYGSFELYLDNGQVVFALTDYNNRRFELSAAYQPDSWNHVVASYDKDAGVVKLYQNGQLAASKQVPVSMGNTFPWRVRVGADCENQDKFDGLIDEVRVYDRSLSDA